MKQQAVLIVGIIIFTFTLCVWGSQQPGDANNLAGLEDYLQYASLNNANLKAVFEQWRVALEEIPQAKALPDPQLTYEYWSRQSDLQMKQTVGVMQTFPWFGKIDARTEAAAKSAEAAQQKYRGARLALFKEVKEGFYEFAYLARATEIATENLELLRHFEEVARTKHMTTEAGHPDVIRAQVEIAKMEDVLRGLNQLREPTVSRLRTALTLPADTNLPWPKQEQFEVLSLDFERLLALLVQKNPELASLNFEAMAAKSRIELAKKNFYPDISVGVGWENMDSRNGRDGVQLVFSMNLPLWRDSYSAGQRQAQAMATGIEQQKVDTENVLLTKVTQAHYEYRDSARKIRLYRDMLIPKGKELLQSSEAAYRSGMVDFLSLLDAQRILLDYYLSYERALVDNRQKLAELETLTGTELDSLQK
ncbi:MAG: TolC family protein [Sedimentisphaerales bacterium]